MRRPPVRVPDKVEMKLDREKTKTIVCKLLKSEDQKEEPHSHRSGCIVGPITDIYYLLQTSAIT